MRPENWLYTTPLRLRSLFRRTQADQELDDELRDHLERKTEEYLAQGMTQEEARRRARLELGGMEQTKEKCRDARKVNWIQDFLQDLHYGVRMLCKSPGFTAVAVLTLALGIGANTAIFSLMNALMLRELPVESPEKVFLFGDGRAGGSSDEIASTQLYSYWFYREARASNHSFSELSAAMSLMFNGMHGTVANGETLEPMNVQLVSGTYFSMLGVNPLLGRTFTVADDGQEGAHPDALISYSWWKRRFAGDSEVLGKTITFRSTVYSIIGVAPPEFFGTMVGQSPDLWIPLSMEKQVSPGWNGLDDKRFESLYIFGRLKTGVGAAQAQAEVNLLAQQLWRGAIGGKLSAADDEQIKHSYIELTPAARGISRLRFEFSQPLKILMGIVALVLLIACANIANLLLARGTARQREISVRVAIGAGRMRLIRQMLTENLVLAALGGALGIWFAWWAGRALLTLVSTGNEPPPLNLAPDARVLAFTLAISIATVVLFGIAPALSGTRLNLTNGLREGKGSVRAGRATMASALIISQVALSLVLIVGAGLFLRTIINLENVPTGFNKENVLLFSIDPVGYKEDARLLNLYHSIEERVGAEPGVKSASISFFTFNQGEWDENVTVEGGTQLPTGIENDVTENVVGPGYFSAMEIPILAGRVFSTQDTAASPRVAVINETMAKRYFQGGSPIGRHFGRGGDLKHAGDFKVIGVVKDAKYIGLREHLRAAAYYPYTQDTRYYYNLVVRYSGSARLIPGEVRAAVSEVDPRLPLVFQSTLVEQVDRSMRSSSLVGKLSTFFGLLAAFLACIGIYGLMSYAVTRRTQEIGIRMAIGAGRGEVLRMVMREVTTLVGIGLVTGIPAALAAGRWAASLLFGLRPADPLTFVAAIFAMLGVGLFAGYLPARRATRVDPIVALRYE